VAVKAKRPPDATAIAAAAAAKKAKQGPTADEGGTSGVLSLLGGYGSSSGSEDNGS
jgi:hypothetical protein